MGRVTHNEGTVMKTCPRHLRRVGKRFATGILLALLAASVARAGDSERKALFAKVSPAIVQVRQERSLGGGFVVDAEKGIVATNYHVIEGAKKVAIFFPADDREMKHGLEADGYFAILPGKDLALVHVKLGHRKATALKLAEKIPEQGDTIYTFGGPLVFDNSVAAGMVTAVRTGQEVSDLLERLSPGMYAKALGYDLDAVWIQHTAPLSHGASGAPLINERGEVVGLNTMNMVVASGGNNNFAISAKHLRDLLAKAGKEVKAWSTLPPPREHSIDDRAGVQKTLAKWKELNKAKCAVDATVTASEDALLEQLLNEDDDAKDRLSVRNKNKAASYKEIGGAYKKYAARIRAIDTELIDPEAAALVSKEIDFAQRMSDAYNELVASLSAQSDPGKAIDESKLSALKQTGRQLRTDYDIIRVILSRKYSLYFPPVEETATGKDNDTNMAGQRPGFRDWTSSSGKFHLRAKYVGRDGDDVKLEKPDGHVIGVPFSKLSQADRRFVEEKEKENKKGESHD